MRTTGAVVIDIGTGSCKIGYAGQQKPSFVVSSTVGKYPRESGQPEDHRKEYFIGRERDVSQKLVNPLRRGIIVDWDCVEAILEYLFVKKMKISADEHKVLLSDPTLSPVTNRERYAEMMFETFNVPAFHIAHQSVLSLRSYGKTCGLVVECGHGASYVVPIIDGKVLQSLTHRADYAGADITEYLRCFVNAGRWNENLGVMEDIKKKYCYVSFNFNNEMVSPSENLAPYTLPDGQRIIIGKERFLCPEAIFQPSLIGSPQPGLQDMTVTCIKNCDASLKILLKNILLCGGTTALQGFPGRFRKELKSLLHQKPNVLAGLERQFSVWIGGSALASEAFFQERWLYRKEYDEHGPSVIYRHF